MASTNTIIDLATKPEIITFGLYSVQTKDGTDESGEPKFKTEYKVTSKDSEIEKARTAGTLVHEQSFSYERAGSAEGIIEVIKDSEEAAAVFNAGLKTRLISRVTALMLDTDEEGNFAFMPVEGNFDLRELLNEPAQRRNLSPIDKAKKTLSAIPGMTDDMLNAMIAQLRANLSPVQQAAQAASELVEV
jgi:hypothetical protein